MRYNPKLIDKLLKLEPHPVSRIAKYSGAPSKRFWERIAAIKNNRVHRLIYIAGCALQDHEERVLKMLEDAETG